MSESLHECAVPNCGRRISLEFLMCPGHWAQVPRDLQRKVYTCWQAWRKNFRNVSAAQAHRAAKDAAVQAVVEGGASA
jgi:hypothetical protein